MSDLSVVDTIRAQKDIVEFNGYLYATAETKQIFRHISDDKEDQPLQIDGKNIVSFSTSNNLEGSVMLNLMKEGTATNERDVFYNYAACSVSTTIIKIVKFLIADTVTAKREEAEAKAAAKKKGKKKKGAVAPKEEVMTDTQAMYRRRIASLVSGVYPDIDANVLKDFDAFINKKIGSLIGKFMSLIYRKQSKTARFKTILVDMQELQNNDMSKKVSNIVSSLVLAIAPGIKDGYSSNVKTLKCPRLEGFLRCVSALYNDLNPCIEMLNECYDCNINQVDTERLLEIANAIDAYSKNAQWMANANISAPAKSNVKSAASIQSTAGVQQPMQQQTDDPSKAWKMGMNMSQMPTVGCMMQQPMIPTVGMNMGMNMPMQTGMMMQQPMVQQPMMMQQQPMMTVGGMQMQQQPMPMMQQQMPMQQQPMVAQQNNGSQQMVW